MRHALAVLSAIAFAAAAYGQPSASPKAQTQTAPKTAEPDPATILRVLGLEPDANGEIENECGERVKPSILAAELGGAIGTARLVAIGGGPNTAACYGDGPDLHLLRAEGASFREIYSARGRMLIILPTSHGGVRDLADGGAGFSFPVWEWNGSVYANAGRQVSDAETAGATILP